MPLRYPILVFGTLMSFLGLAWFPVQALPQTVSSDPQSSPLKSLPAYQPQPPSQAELAARTKKLIANQHSDDLAGELYERMERHKSQTGGPNPRILEDKTIRFVPNGAGTSKILLSDNGKPADPAEYRRQLQDVRQVLAMMTNPDDPRAKAATAKYQKRLRDSADLVNAVGDAFVLTWQGAGSKNGRDCDIIQASPNPNFHPRSLQQEVLTHVSAKVWVDHSTDQIVHIDAQILSDIPFGGGVLYKLYRGGTFALDQAEVTPGIWLPTHEQYDFSGRKFLFPFEEHVSIDFQKYQFVGPPKQALALVQAELAGAKSASGDP